MHYCKKVSIPSLPAVYSSQPQCERCFSICMWGADLVLEAVGQKCEINMCIMAKRVLSEVARLKIKTVVLILHPAPAAWLSSDKRIVSSEMHTGEIEQLNWKHTMNVFWLKNGDSQPNEHLQDGSCMSPKHCVFSQ